MEVKKVDDKKPIPAVEQAKPVVNPTKPVDLTEDQKKIKELERKYQETQEKLREKATENATLLASQNDMQAVTDTDDDIPESMPPDEAKRISQIMQEDPDRGAKELDDYNARILRENRRKVEERGNKQNRTNAEVQKFVENIYTQKPHLRKHDDLLGKLRMAEFARTGKPFESIVNAVKEFEERILPNMKEEETIPKDKPKPKEPEKEEEVPSGALGETGTSTAPAETVEEAGIEASEEPTSVSDAIAERENRRSKQIARSRSND